MFGFYRNYILKYIKLKWNLPEILNEVFDIECPYPLKNEIWDVSHETLVL